MESYYFSVFRPDIIYQLHYIANRLQNYSIIKLLQANIPNTSLCDDIRHAKRRVQRKQRRQQQENGKAGKISGLVL